MTLSYPSLLILALVTLLITQTSTAGPISSGGGMAVQCLNKPNETHFKVLDYYEAEKKYKSQNLTQPSGSLEKDYQQLVINTYFLQGSDIPVDQEILLRNLQYFESKIQWSLSDKMPHMNDSGDHFPLEPHCKMVPLAIFYDQEEKILLAKDIWDQLDSINKATLIMHEFYYFQERVYFERTSESTRQFVQYLLTPQLHTPVNSGLNQKIASCTSQGQDFFKSTPNFHFYLVPTKKGTLIQFSQFSGRPLLVKTAILTPLTLNSTTLTTEWGEKTPITIVKAPHQNLEPIYPLPSEQRKHWQLQLIFKHQKPLQIQAYYKNKPFGDRENIFCHF